MALLSALTAAALAGSLGMAGTSPAKASTTWDPCTAYPGGQFAIAANNGNGQYFIDNPGHGGLVKLQQYAYVTYSFMNCQRWTDLDGDIVEVTELGFPSNNLCLNDDTYNTGWIYLDSCVKGDLNELFYVGPTLGPQVFSVSNSELFGTWSFLASQWNSQGLPYSGAKLAGNELNSNIPTAKWAFGLITGVG